jgi:cation diffusion facilitator family transporter
MSEQVLKNESRQDQDLQSGLTVTRVGVLSNILLVILKLMVGYMGRSQALIADGVHSFSDLFSDAVVYFGLKWGRKEADESHPYGHGRIETLSGLIVGLILFLVGVGIAYNSLEAIHGHAVSIPSALAIYVAGFSVVLKEALYWYTIAVGRRINSPVVIANAWHHRTDAMSSVAVLIGVTAAYFNPEWYLADSIAALVVSFFIFRVALALMSTAVKELVDTTPGPEVMSEMRSRASAIDGVHQIHDLTARRSGPHILVELHIVVDKHITVLEGHNIAERVEKVLIAEVSGVARVTTHIDPDTVDDRKGQL